MVGNARTHSDGLSFVSVDEGSLDVAAVAAAAEPVSSYPGRTVGSFGHVEPETDAPFPDATGLGVGAYLEVDGGAHHAAGGSEYLTVQSTAGGQGTGAQPPSAPVAPRPAQPVAANAMHARACNNEGEEALPMLPAGPRPTEQVPHQRPSYAVAVNPPVAPTGKGSVVKQLEDGSNALEESYL